MSVPEVLLNETDRRAHQAVSRVIAEHFEDYLFVGTLSEKDAVSTIYSLDGAVTLESLRVIGGSIALGVEPERQARALLEAINAIVGGYKTAGGKVDVGLVELGGE